MTDIERRERESIEWNYNCYNNAIACGDENFKLSYRDFTEWLQGSFERSVSIKKDLNEYKKGFLTLFDIAWNYDIPVIIVKKLLREARA